MKTCFKCQKEKPLSMFYPHPRMRDGHLNKCIECAKTDTENRRKELEATDPSWVLSELRRHRKKSQKARKDGRASKSAPDAHKKWTERHPIKYKAHNALSNAIRDGKIKRQKCWCGRPAQAHHEDYSKPLEVIWLCVEHHNEHHVNQREAKLISQI